MSHFIKPRNAKVWGLWKAPKAVHHWHCRLARTSHACHSLPARGPRGPSTLAPRYSLASMSRTFSLFHSCSQHGTLTVSRRQQWLQNRTDAVEKPRQAATSAFGWRLWMLIGAHHSRRQHRLALGPRHPSPRLRSNRAHHRPRHIRPPSPRSRAWWCAQVHIFAGLAARRARQGGCCADAPAEPSREWEESWHALIDRRPNS
mgnify:CR=1 FL=1